MTFSLYLSRFFTLRVLLIWLFFVSLTILGDTIELSRSFAGRGSVGYGDIFFIALLRAPYFNEEILPFAILFASLLCLYLWSQRMELVIARSAGISVWQFLAPLCVVAIFMGFFTSMIYDPLALSAQRQSKVYESRLVVDAGGEAQIRHNYWVRLPRESGDSIIRASVSQRQGRNLSDATFFIFNSSGILEHRYDTQTAEFTELSNNRTGYTLYGAKRISPDSVPIDFESIFLSFNVSVEELELKSSIAKETDFWHLRDQASRAKKADRNPLSFVTRYHSLLSLPLLFLSMVLISSCVALTFLRYSNNRVRIMSGIIGAFVLYTISELVLTFGENGLLSPILVSYFPSLIAILLSLGLLLHQEDG